MPSSGDTTVNNKRHDSCPHGLQCKEGFHMLQIRCFSNIDKIDALPAMAEQLGLGSLLIGLKYDPWVGKIPWRKEWPPTPVFLPAELHGQRSLDSLQSMGSQ